MTKTSTPIPEGYRTVTPYLTVRNAAAALDFYTRAFGADEQFRMADPSGKIGHAEISIGDSKLMLSDEYPEMDALSPESIGGTPVTIHLYVENVDALVERAVGAGARIERPVADQFYGDRAGMLVDPFGFKWWIATHVEDVAPDELERRAARSMQDAADVVPDSARARSTQSDYSLSQSSSTEADERHFEVAEEQNFDQQSDAARHLGRMPDEGSAGGPGQVDPAQAMSKSLQREKGKDAG
jgi:PhnB protein